MRLTTLEIKGFKSFGDKVLIHFDKGVTSVVGPNGSGKSNVVDAMRWVLGEQKTRMLRSEKMENIIFNGTKNRKPANLAEVSITFENTKNILPTEFQTVTVTRRLYRTGESEYLLNGVGCRLKDITDLFLDTGIGPDSYAIIELKMVDEILNDKNNAIKNLFEEAAGISKYKIRKKQTFNKLEETEADLNRVNDLLFEIERNMKSLESQAKKTERYYKLRETYKELSTELALFTLAASKDTFNELQQKEEQQLQEKISFEAQLAETEAGLQQEKLVMVDREKELSESQKLLNEKINNLRQHEHDKKLNSEKLNHLQDKEQRLNTQLNTDKNTLVLTQEECRRIDEDKLNEENLLLELNASLDELKVIVDRTREKHDLLKSEINTKNAEAQAIQREIHESEKSFAVTQARKDSLQTEIERLQNENSNRQNEIDQLLNGLNDAQKIKEEKETAFATLLSNEEDTLAAITQTEELIKKSGDDILAQGRLLDARQNEYNLIKSLVENLEGYPESLRFIKKNYPDAHQVPLFADIINCKIEYKNALENFLEPYMNYFVIENVEAAGKAINLLSEASKGRANFFILQNFAHNDSHRPEIAGCVNALSILDVDDKYKALCQHLLGHVYIVTENQDQTPFLQNDNASLHFISQNGKYCKTKHTLSGGSVGLMDGKRIGRIKNLETLQKQIEELSAKVDELKSNRDFLQEKFTQLKQQRDVFNSDKNKLQSEVNNSSTQFNSLRNKIEHLQSQLTTANVRHEELDLQLKTIDNTLAENNVTFQEMLHSLMTNFENLNQHLHTLQLEFSSAADELNTQNANYNQHHIQCIQQQNKIASIIRDISYKNNLIQTLTTNISTNSSEFEVIQEQVRELITSSGSTDELLIELYTEKEVFEKNTGELETNYYKLRGEIEALESKTRLLRNQKDTAEQILSSVKEKTTELKIQLNSLKERLSVEFNIDINDILEREISADWTLETITEKVGKVKNQLDNYGPINPMAVEAYNEIKERYDFINVQKDDLARAKESLLATIKEIDETAKVNFMSAFTQVRENFIKVFRSLFTEDDRCDLVLLDPENPTESDIQIIAQPKGKRPLSISQLSGGEKTLTATALLFGLYLLKPAPFCIFDEVDAPLDDANIDKFNNIIKTFSQESQFIIITHNKRTMSFCDIIYGITMIELGVTQVVPVDLAELVE